MGDLAFFDILSKEDSILREFISYLHEDAVGIFLVARSQDKTHSSASFEQLFPEEMEM